MGKYKGSIDCAMQILKNEGFMSMMRVPGPTSSVVSLVLVCSPVSTSSRPCTSRGEPASKKCSTSTTTDSHSFDPQLHAKINTSYCRWFGLYKQRLKSIVNVSDCSYIEIKLYRTKK